MLMGAIKFPPILFLCKCIPLPPQGSDNPDEEDGDGSSVELTIKVSGSSDDLVAVIGVIVAALVLLPLGFLVFRKYGKKSGGEGRRKFSEVMPVVPIPVAVAAPINGAAQPESSSTGVSSSSSASRSAAIAPGPLIKRESEIGREMDAENVVLENISQQDRAQAEHNLQEKLAKRGTQAQGRNRTTVLSGPPSARGVNVAPPSAGSVPLNDEI
jgi:hypothetical protein